MAQSVDNAANPAFYTVRDVQKLLGVGRNNAYNLVRQKGFPAIYVGNRIVIPSDLFQKWVAEQSENRRGGGAYGKGTT
jgi:excisionase family DNA binding protein